MSKKKLTRRKFLAAAAGAYASIQIVPRHVLGGTGFTPPSEKLNIAGIGVGGMGFNDLKEMATENIVALCDVDWKNADKAFKEFPHATRYKDYRVMLDKQKDIDAVMIATPDHTHAIITMAAIRHGKHVYTEKPLTLTVYESRKVTEAARKAGVVTQMGNMGHSFESARQVCEWIWDGAIGDVYEVHAFTPHPVTSTGIPRPTDTPPMPEGLDWDIWLGPAPYRPYHPLYHPGQWRIWWDFSTGTLGDMGPHIFDHVKWALKLGAPESVEATYSHFVPPGELTWDPPKNIESFPQAVLAHYQFPAREGFPPLKLTWYDGGLRPPRPVELEAGRKMGDQFGGALYVGTKGKILTGSHGARGARIIPESKMQEYRRPPETLPRCPKGHHQEWISACKGQGTTGSNFDFAGPLTETALLGNISLRTDEKLYWDSENFRFTNSEKANEFLHYPYRKGWEL